MTNEQAQYLIDTLKQKEVLFDTGLSDDEINQVQQKFDIIFPPDLKLFLQTGLPISDNFVDWRSGLTSKAEADRIFSDINWPLEGMLFDIANSVFWVDEWGLKPGNYEEQVLVAKKHYETYPKLIPIFSHRYIPQQPGESDNPVFSVYQTDIIYYGYDLATYLANEFHFSLPSNFNIPDKPVRQIEFWSECAEAL